MSDKLKAADAVEHYILFKEFRKRAAAEHWKQLERTGMAYEFHPKGVAERAFIDGWLAALWAVKNATTEAARAAQPAKPEGWTRVCSEEIVACFDSLYDSYRREEIEQNLAEIIAKHAPKAESAFSAENVPIEEVVSLLVAAGKWIRRIEERHAELSKHYRAFLDNIGEEEIRKFRKQIFAMRDFLERMQAEWRKTP
jgi:hypothetical protein